MRSGWFLGLLVLLGCAASDKQFSGTGSTNAPNGSQDSAYAPQWLIDATESDRNRISQWRVALIDGRDAALAGSDAAKVRGRGNLYDPDSALDDVAIPEGLYNCNISKLGPKGGTLPYVDYPDFRCRVADQGKKQQFTKLTGSQRTTGWIYPDSDRQQIYLGTLFYGYENAATPYGESNERDQAAVLHRIGARRWRLVFPRPFYESQVDVMELTPVAE